MILNFFKTSYVARLMWPAAAALAGVLLLSLQKPAVEPLKKTAAPAPVYPVPDARQLAWHHMEMNAFIHFTTNTFTGREWGEGSEPESVFNPTGVDATQWATTLKDAGFKGIILTAKHHDGFCLWPSKYTSHSVKGSPWKAGHGDVVRLVSDAAKNAGLKFGVYLSPWDRNRADYGQPSYITYYRNQLRELFANYGPVFEMWFDGANGGNGYYGGANETRKINGATYYNWPATLQMVRGLQPQVLFFSDAGPDLRWVGNERGEAGTTNWNTITNDTLYAGKSGIQDLLNTGAPDGTKWIPAEVDVSIRPGWFYHAAEDSLVKTPAQLFDIYLTSVGRGSTLLLNVPPDTAGRFHPQDVASLRGFRKILDSMFKKDLAKAAVVTADSYRGHDKTFSPQNLTDGNDATYWATDDGKTNAVLQLDFRDETTLHYLLLQEYIPLGQRVKAFAVFAWQNGDWKKLEEGSTIGYKRILKLGGVSTQKLQVRITGSKACPVLSNIELY